MADLTDADYDALFAVMQADMPRMRRDILPDEGPRINARAEFLSEQGLTNS